MRRTLSIIVLAFGLAFTVVPSASADPLPPCETITSLNCTGTFSNYQTGDQFVQVVEGTFTAHPFWPFRNPTVNAHAATSDPDAFPADYMTTKAMLETRNATVAEQGVELGRLIALASEQRHIIRHQRAIIRRLRARVHAG